MFDQLLGGVQCNLDELVGREEEGGGFQARNIISLLIYRFKITDNGSPQEPLAEWMRAIDVFLTP